MASKNYGPGGIYKKLDAAYAAYSADRLKQNPKNAKVTLAPKQRFAQIWGWTKGAKK